MFLSTSLCIAGPPKNLQISLSPNSWTPIPNPVYYPSIPYILPLSLPGLFSQLWAPFGDSVYYGTEYVGIPSGTLVWGTPYTQNPNPQTLYTMPLYPTSQWVYIVINIVSPRWYLKLSSFNPYMPRVWMQFSMFFVI